MPVTAGDGLEVGGAVGMIDGKGVGVEAGVGMEVGAGAAQAHRVTRQKSANISKTRDFSLEGHWCTNLPDWTSGVLFAALVHGLGSGLSGAEHFDTFSGQH